MLVERKSINEPSSQATLAAENTCAPESTVLVKGLRLAYEQRIRKTATPAINHDADREATWEQELALATMMSNKSYNAEYNHKTSEITSHFDYQQVKDISESSSYNTQKRKGNA